MHANLYRSKAFVLHSTSDEMKSLPIRLGKYVITPRPKTFKYVQAKQKKILTDHLLRSSKLNSCA